MLVLARPAIYALELTPHCDHRCVGCSNVYAEDRRFRPLPAAVWESLLESIAPDAVQIRLTGGEPTLHPEFFRILRAATSYEAWVTVFTHGDWPDPTSVLDGLAGVPRLSGLLISLHGARAEDHEHFTRVPGSFQRTVENVRLAVARGLRVSLSSIITRHNWDNIDAVVALADSLGAEHVTFNRYLGTELPGIEPDQDQLRAAVRRIEQLIAEGAAVRYGICIPQCFLPNASEGCLAGAAYATIDPVGNLRPCSHSPTVVGSVVQEGIDALWHSPRMEAWRGLMPSECQTCAAYEQCHGGCRAVQELRADRRDPLRGQRLDVFIPPAADTPLPTTLPSSGVPRLQARLQPQTFGYTLSGAGQVVPVRAEARSLLEACDGSATLAELAAQFGQPSVALLGELWSMGLLAIE